MSQTIFAVAAGSYDEYRIVAVFTSEARAREYIASLPIDADVNPEPIAFDLDPEGEEVPGVWKASAAIDGDDDFEHTWFAADTSVREARRESAGGPYTFYGYGASREAALRLARLRARAHVRSAGADR